MQRSQYSLSTGGRLFWLATSTLVCACCAAATYGQVGEPRYGTAPDAQTVVPSSAETGAGEPLISYRRDEPTSANTVRVGATSSLSAPTGGDNEASNPLRASSQSPPPRFDSIRPSTDAPEAKVETTAVAPGARYSTPLGAATSTSASPLPAEITPLPAAPVATPAATPAATESKSDAIVVAPVSEPAAVSNPFAGLTLPPRYDAAVAPAAYEADAPKGDKPAEEKEAKPADAAGGGWADRRLAPQSPEAKAASSSESSPGATARLPFGLSKLDSLSTAGAGLVIVVGLFIVCMWLARRSGGKASGMLPAQAFALLGRAPLTAQSFVHLLRVGNKLVLVAMTADGAQPLTEVTDPIEVDRLTSLCASNRGHGPAAEFQQVLAQLAREPARGFLGNEASSGRRSA